MSTYVSVVMFIAENVAVNEPPSGTLLGSNLRMDGPSLAIAIAAVRWTELANMSQTPKPTTRGTFIRGRPTLGGADMIVIVIRSDGFNADHLNGCGSSFPRFPAASAEESL
jgi:hypothetical protein